MVSFKKAFPPNNVNGLLQQIIQFHLMYQACDIFPYE